MGSGPPDGILGEDELREVISLQIVIDSARAAGLEVASPIAAESGDGLLVYGAAATAESSLRARRVRVRAFDSGLETAALADPTLPGDLLALVEWGGLGENEAVFLLAAKDIDGVRSGQVALSECCAAPERWRMLVLG